jgi:hypothetical protein
VSKIQELNNKMNKEISDITKYYMSKIDEIQKIVHTKEKLQKLVNDLQKNGVDLESLNCLKTYDYKKQKNQSNSDTHTNN